MERLLQHLIMAGRRQGMNPSQGAIAFVIWEMCPHLAALRQTYKGPHDMCIATVSG